MNSFLFFHEINEQNFVFLIKFYNCVEYNGLYGTISFFLLN